MVKWTFWTSPGDPFVTSCVADVENWCFCGGGGGGGGVVFLDVLDAQNCLDGGLMDPKLW